jgi:hypothetical protein
VLGDVVGVGRSHVGDDERVGHQFGVVETGRGSGLLRLQPPQSGRHGEKLGREDAVGGVGGAQGVRYL